MYGKRKIGVIVLTLLAVLVSACGGGGAQPPTPTTAPTAAVQPSPTVPPTPTVPPASPTPAPTPTPAERSVRVDALAFAQGTQGAYGVTTPTRIQIRPAAQPGELRVGFFEEEVGGIGPQWHASGWIAVLLGSMLEGVDPTDYEFSFSVGGYIDGPSAGALMTVGVLAALRGDTVREDASMTGTINPDGTVGPVGGIPHKLQGAAEAGKKLVLVPVGQRYDYDYNQQQYVDLVDVGRQLGIEVREVSNIYEAYELLTGSPLPRPQVSTSTPAFPQQAYNRLEAKAKEWYSRYQKARNEFLAFPEEIQQVLADQVLEADQVAGEADQALGQGLAAVAYSKAEEAASMMEQANLTAGILERYLTGGLNDAVDYLQATMAVETELSAVVDLLQAESPRTVSDQLALFDAYSEIGIAEGLRLVGNSIVNDLIQNAGYYSEEELVTKLATAAAYYTLASDFVQLARDAVDIGMGFGSAPAVEPEKAMRIAETMRRAAEANMALFESTIVEPWAQQYGLSLDTAKGVWQNAEIYYLLAEAARLGINTLGQQVGSGPESAGLVFGHSQSAYTLSAMLIAKHYSLGAQVDQDLNIVGYQNEKALAEMLDFADRRARELINLAGDNASISALFYYENARMLRQGDADDQMTALSYYWQAALLAQLGAYMAGK